VGSRDPLYEFSQTSFETRFAAALQHALLPILEYMEDVYAFQPDIYNITVSNYKYLNDKSYKFTLESEPILKPILQANYDNNRNQESNHSGQLWKSIIDFSIPKAEDHEFWHRSGLNRMDGKFRNSVPLQVYAFGASKEEARTFAFIKLTNLIEWIRTILRSIKETKDMDLVISKLLRQPTISLCYDMNCPALDIGVRLFEFYGRHRKEQNIWPSMTTFIKQSQKVYPIELQPLLQYYLVYPSFRQLM
jgi:hypothetical protein